ncbi:hypothetical protein ACP4OV_005513 [Aristida adscensionis]
MEAHCAPRRRHDDRHRAARGGRPGAAGTRRVLWLAAPLESDTVTFVAGLMFMVVTNERVPACVHRVRTPSNRDRERFSVLIGSRPKGGAAGVRALEELVQEGRRTLVYNPSRPNEYSAFRLFKEGSKFSDPLKAICEAGKDGSMELSKLPCLSDHFHHSCQTIS